MFGGRLWKLRHHRVQAGIGEEAVGLTVGVMSDGGLRLAFQAFHQGGVDSSAFQHGAVGPAGVVVPADEEDRHIGPFALVEALLQFRHLAPGC
ncbi:hypothetical protein D9M68_484460 [compost metagenome]